MGEKVKKGYPYYDMFQMTHNESSVFLNVSVNDEGENEHNHDFYELLTIISGNGLHCINGKTYQVVPGDVFLLNIGDRHYFTPLSVETEFRWINIGWLPSFYQLDDPMLQENKKYTDHASMNITNLLMDGLYEYNLKQDGYQEVIFHHLMAILKKLKRLTAVDGGSYSEKHRQNMVKQAAAYIGEHYRESLTLRSIADELNISQVYLCKLFSNEMGMGAIQYLRKTRIDKACSLLRTTNLRVKDIAAHVGFSDTKSFFSAFKIQTGITPTQYKMHFKDEGESAEVTDNASK